MVFNDKSTENDFSQFMKTNIDPECEIKEQYTYDEPLKSKKMNQNYFVFSFRRFFFLFFFYIKQMYKTRQKHNKKEKHCTMTLHPTFI